MGVFSRFKDIMSANINSILDKAENPEKMIKLMIQEMEDTLVEQKSACAAKMAAKTKAEREIRETEQMMTRWQARAELAVEKKKDDLAREALSEKMKYKKDAEIIQADVEQYDKLITECKENIIKIEEKLQTVRQKHKLLIQRGMHAKEQIKAKETIRDAAGSKAFQRFSEMEGRIERMEAEAEMAGFAVPGGLEDEFQKLESNSDVEAELQALKNSVKKEKK
jgi:phage shock protein A